MTSGGSTGRPKLIVDALPSMIDGNAGRIVGEVGKQGAKILPTAKHSMNEILDQPTILPTFDFEYNKFAREFVAHFSASFEQDGSFAFFRKGDSISGQIGGDEFCGFNQLEDE